MKEISTWITTIGHFWFNFWALLYSGKLHLLHRPPFLGLLKLLQRSNRMRMQFLTAKSKMLQIILGNEDEAKVDTGSKPGGRQKTEILGNWMNAKSIFCNLTIPCLFFLIFVFTLQLAVNKCSIEWQLNQHEPGSSVVGSDRSGTTTGHWRQ